MSEPSPFVPIEALSQADLEREQGDGFVDVTIRVRILIPEKQHYPLYNMPYLRIKKFDTRTIECRNVIVLKELSMPEEPLSIAMIRM